MINWGTDSADFPNLKFHMSMGEATDELKVWQAEMMSNIMLACQLRPTTHVHAHFPLPPVDESYHTGTGE